MIDYTPTGFVNDSPPPISAAELNKIGLVLGDLVTGDKDHTIKILKLALVLAQNGKLNPDIIEDESIRGSQLADVYPKLYFNSVAPTASSAGKLGDMYIHTYTSEGIVHRDIYLCYDATLDHKVWQKELTLEEANLRFLKLPVSVNRTEDVTNLDRYQFFDWQGDIGIKTSEAGLSRFIVLEKRSNKVLVVSETSRDSEYPSAKAVYDFVVSTAAVVIGVGWNAPTASTVGKLGDFFIQSLDNNGNKAIFYCLGKLSNDYLWTQISTKSYVDALYSTLTSHIEELRPRIVTGISLSPSGWNNNRQEVLLPPSTNITANTKADVEVGESSYTILKAAGVERIWVENDGDTLSPILTACIIGTPPDETFYIQLTLTEVRT